jgi:hypothetical protein
MNKVVGGVRTNYLVDDQNPTGLPQVMEEVVNGVVRVRYAYGTSIIAQTRSVGGSPQTRYYAERLEQARELAKEWDLDICF